MNEMRACTRLGRIRALRCRASQVWTTANLASPSRYDDAPELLGRYTCVGVTTLVLLTKRSLGPCATPSPFSQPGPWAPLRHHVVG